MTARLVGLSGLAGLLLTAAVFALAWPVFTRMRNQRIWYQHVEDPYLHDHTDLALVALCALPLFLLLLGTGSAALQAVCSRAVAAGSRASPEGEPSDRSVPSDPSDRPDPSVPSDPSDRPDRSRAVAVARLRPVLAVYALRALIVWPLPVLAEAVANSLTGPQLDTDQQFLERGSWLYALVAASPAAALFAAVLLRLALGLAPAAAAGGLGPLTALRRSWSLVRTRTGAVRVLALALPLAALTAGLVRLVVQLALPLRPLVRGLLEEATGNFFAAYYAGILAPVVVGLLAAAAVVLPVSCTAFAVLHERLRSSRASGGG
ncbi:hypothetical protein [Streptomyces sp. NPDC004042]|uniref:hypothetical protein n=1 Tax=Streptomyces sp. NPDC004042 TaxID=3154451 RepID=UPI0033ABB60C